MKGLFARKEYIDPVLEQLTEEATLDTISF